MTRYLPLHLQELFKPRPPLEYLPPPERHKSRGYTGIAAFVDRFDTNPDQSPPTEYFEVLTLSEIRERKKKLKQEQCLKEMNKKFEEWDPQKNPKSVSDAYKTLFVARLSYKVTEQMLYKEFEQVGPVKSVHMVYDLEGKPRGYAFVEMVHEGDLRVAYDTMNGRKILDRNIFVDVERGRTVTNWRPRRFGNSEATPRVALLPKSSRSIISHHSGSNGFRPGGARDRRDDRRYSSSSGPHRGDRDRARSSRSSGYGSRYDRR
ncbi:U1 small nuclear ribonucleoprotein 70 kDa-like [Schistocerca gregaria]|uniref:U1 small nuclear ribonucleoprotein 70 kDa-like n=1 Tax=Schistocerca gregaria TaxID=7010 RepID=UPI00211E1017|nr:U1 small nuclear ribonucleoprotein 70 kDa-like [Schistocerca gregaria]